jgi:hypothetical protein
MACGVRAFTPRGGKFPPPPFDEKFFIRGRFCGLLAFVGCVKRAGGVQLREGAANLMFDSEEATYLL